MNKRDFLISILNNEITRLGNPGVSPTFYGARNRMKAEYDQRASEITLDTVCVGEHTFKNISAAARAFNIDFNTARSRFQSSNFKEWHAESVPKIPRCGRGKGNKRMREVIIDGVTYESTYDAARKLGLFPASVRFRVTSDLPHFSEWKYK